jgi:hypothetical protein
MWAVPGEIGPSRGVRVRADFDLGRAGAVGAKAFEIVIGREDLVK